MNESKPGFYRLTISKLQKETKDATTVFFHIPEKLQHTFDYKSGQYLTIEIDINGTSVRRAYSLCTSPFANESPAVTVKKVEQGLMSNYINDHLKEGDEMDVMPPNGKFIVEPGKEGNPLYILFGGGSGITPLMSIIKTVLIKESESRIFLVYANRDPQSVIFKSVLDSLEKEHKDRLKVIYSYDNPPMMWFGLKGFLTEKSVAETLKARIGGSWTDAKYYICGPSGMMDLVVGSLKKLGIKNELIHTEYFTSTTKKTPLNAIEKTPDSVDMNTAQVTVHLYGNTHEMVVSKNQTLLDAANRAGLQPPFSCTVGVCTTCRAKVHSGKVEMLEREGLSDQEIDEGYILTCQSIPKSERIEITFE